MPGTLGTDKACLGVVPALFQLATHTPAGTRLKICLCAAEQWKHVAAALQLGTEDAAAQVHLLEEKLKPGQPRYSDAEIVEMDKVLGVVRTEMRCLVKASWAAGLDSARLEPLRCLFVCQHLRQTSCRSGPTSTSRACNTL